MNLQEKQAQLTVLGLQIESLSAQHNKLKSEIITEMNMQNQQQVKQPVEVKDESKG
jgi:4'-phosphopantetheinyl transferase EntD